MSIEIVGTIERETAAEILVHVDAVDEKHWIPLSQVDEIHREQPARVVISDWIARKLGLD